jgi:AraC family transcriptional regulator of adaptative response / DNA-3-methyladenine glycosylase II
VRLDVAGETRSLRLPHGPGVVALSAGTGSVRCELRLTDLRDLAAAVQRSRRLLDLDADPTAVQAALGADPLLGPLVRKASGLRVPGHVDGAEMAVRAVVSRSRCRPAPAANDPGPTAIAARPRHGDQALPDPEALRGAGQDGRPCGHCAIAGPPVAGSTSPGRRPGGAGDGCCSAASARGPRPTSRCGARDPDVFLPTDVGVRHALDRLGVPSGPASAAALAELAAHNARGRVPAGHPDRKDV